ncbi:hypothetical protein FVE85_3882 [Porphyridium purpureum]|uniref:Uncharacterized protein n=1 Tax=Porphyridium purpureum TaxID=35688 RepID=A0A5J4YU18_PORPP|nr:hypothetical protein FVE85_3882 [Porphyridium purpureum]|eukprot:POR7427..scf229_5
MLLGRIAYDGCGSESGEHGGAGWVPTNALFVATGQRGSAAHARAVAYAAYVARWGAWHVHAVDRHGRCIMRAVVWCGDDRVRVCEKVRPVLRWCDSMLVLAFAVMVSSPERLGGDQAWICMQPLDADVDAADSAERTVHILVSADDFDRLGQPTYPMEAGISNELRVSHVRVLNGDGEQLGCLTYDETKHMWWLHTTETSVEVLRGIESPEVSNDASSGGLPCDAARTDVTCIEPVLSAHSPHGVILGGADGSVRYMESLIHVLPEPLATVCASADGSQALCVGMTGTVALVGGLKWARGAAVHEDTAIQVAARLVLPLSDSEPIRAVGSTGNDRFLLSFVRRIFSVQCLRDPQGGSRLVHECVLDVTHDNNSYGLICNAQVFMELERTAVSVCVLHESGHVELIEIERESPERMSAGHLSQHNMVDIFKQLDRIADERILLMERGMRCNDAVESLECAVRLQAHVQETRFPPASSGGSHRRQKPVACLDRTTLRCRPSEVRKVLPFSSGGDKEAWIHVTVSLEAGTELSFGPGWVLLCEFMGDAPFCDDACLKSCTLNVPIESMERVLFQGSEDSPAFSARADFILCVAHPYMPVTCFPSILFVSPADVQYWPSARGELTFSAALDSFRVDLLSMSKVISTDLSLGMVYVQGCVSLCSSSAATHSIETEMRSLWHRLVKESKTNIDATRSTLESCFGDRFYIELGHHEKKGDIVELRYACSTALMPWLHAALLSRILEDKALSCATSKVVGQDTSDRSLGTVGRIEQMIAESDLLAQHCVRAVESTHGHVTSQDSVTQALAVEILMEAHRSLRTK